ncbi:MAG: DUF2784 domain-containing protein [Burkholderiales bacterium]|nr:MAG: DUF2784 domain-containing protein [Burkholderiales bacterium]
MTARLAADALVLVHLLFIVFAVLGGLLVAWRARVAWLHLPAAAWGAWAEFSGAICPLTPLENHYRRLAGETGYAGSFVERYLVPVVYPDGLTPQVQQWLGALVIAINVAIYFAVLLALRWRDPRGR